MIGSATNLNTEIATSTSNPLPKRQVLGEIVEASYTEFTAESYQLHQTPTLGRLVRAEHAIGVVHKACTESIGLTSREGKPDDQDGTVYKLHPEFEYTLHTRFSALAVGYYNGSRIIHAYPDTLPRLHYQCYLLDDAATLEFTVKPGYLRPLVNASDCCVDEAIAYLLGHVFYLHGKDRGHLLNATAFLSRLLKGQYDRLVGILETLDEMLGDDYAAGGEWEK